jgi:hypothetical protein
MGRGCVKTPGEPVPDRLGLKLGAIPRWAELF